MAQLIKLQDYTSRYEDDIYRYPSQYVRLKKQQWEKLLDRWERDRNLQFHANDAPAKEHRKGALARLKGLFAGQAQLEGREDILQDGENRETDLVQFPKYLEAHASTEAELKQLFLDQMFKFQLKWASATLTEKSFIDSHYFREEKLKYLLQRFPDTFFVMYEPVFLLKKAPVELDILLLTPTGAWCLAFLERETNAAFTGSSDHFWYMRHGDHEERVLNPLLSVNRMGKIIQQLFKLYDIELPIHKAVLCRNGYVDYPGAGDVLLLDKRNYEEWFLKMRRLHSPLKKMQLRAAQGLLEYCQTTSFKRPEWEIDIEQDAE